MKLIAMYILVLLMFVSLIINQRFYPFTNFYMFSNLKTQPHVCTVGFRDNLGQVHYLENYLYWPLTRLSIHQMCMGFKFKKYYAWLDVIKEQLPSQYKDKKFLIHIVEYNSKTNTMFAVEEIYEETF